MCIWLSFSFPFRLQFLYYSACFHACLKHIHKQTNRQTDIQTRRVRHKHTQTAQTILQSILYNFTLSLLLNFPLKHIWYNIYTLHILYSMIFKYKKKIVNIIFYIILIILVKSINLIVTHKWKINSHRSENSQWNKRNAQVSPENEQNPQNWIREWKFSF